MTTTLFTSESVSAGHPDKICDQLSDALLDAYLEQDSNARIAIETGIKDHTVFVFGEVTSTATINAEDIVRQVLTALHPTDKWGFDVNKLDIISRLTQQSPNIAQGVDGEDTGAGDQGLMFGYANTDTPEFMPLPISLAHALIAQYDVLRTQQILGPDAKAQVSVLYDGDTPVKVDSLVFSAQHPEDMSLVELKECLLNNVVKPALGIWYTPDITLHLNPAGTFHIGGPVADAGLTGRKIIVDTYGGFARHGGGAFSGKDGTKVDRAAAYGARQLARDVVRRGWAQGCEVGVGYAIGHSAPVSLSFTTDSGADIEKLYDQVGIDIKALLKPSSLIKRLRLQEPGFLDTATGGHFGKDFAWEENIT